MGSVLAARQRSRRSQWAGLVATALTLLAVAVWLSRRTPPTSHTPAPSSAQPAPLPPPAEPAVPPPADAAETLAKAWHAFEAATPPTAEATKALVLAYEVMVAAEGTPPAGVPGFDELQRILRAALAGLDNRGLRAFFEYTAATRAVTHGDVGEHERAAKHLAEVVRDGSGDGALDANAGLLLASLQRTLGDTAACFRTLDLVAARLGPPTPDNAWLHGALAGERSDALCGVGRIDEAGVAAQESLRIALATDDEHSLEHALLRVQTVCLATGRFGPAVEQLSVRLEQRQQANAPAAELALLRLFLGYARAGLAGDDVDGMRAARTILDEAARDGAGHVRRRAVLKRFDLALRCGDLETAAAVDAECRAGFGERTGEAVAAADARELEALQARLSLQRGAPREELARHAAVLQAAVVQLGAEWRREPVRLTGTGFLHVPQRRTLIGTALDATMASGGAPAAALQLLLDLQACTSLARVREAPPCTVAGVQAQLGARVVLVYLPAPTATHVFLLTATAVEHERLPGDRSRDPALQALLEALAARVADDGVLHDGPAVRDRLLPERWLPRLLAADGLTVVGAELLGSVPFEVMPLGDGRLLGEAVPMDTTGSLPLSLAIARSVRPVPAAHASVALFACTDPAPAEGHPAVDPIRFPADDVLSSLADYARPPSTMLGERASTAAFRELPFAEHTVAHLVLHGSEPRGIAEEPGLRTFDGVIARPELTQRRWPGLVIVSACGSGRGPRRAGEGDAFHSLAGACLWNGAAAVIGSRRDLAARAHLRLLAACHRHLAKGCTPAAAMQRARAECAAGADVWTRAQAAQVQVFGAGHAPVVSPR